MEIDYIQETFTEYLLYAVYCVWPDNLEMYLHMVRHRMNNNMFSTYKHKILIISFVDRNINRSPCLDW